MIRPKLTSLTYAALLTLGFPAAVHAIDITLYPGPIPGAASTVIEHAFVSTEASAATSAVALELMDEQAGDLWDRVRSGFQIPDLNNALTVNRTKWYSAQPEYFERTLNRGSRYLYHVVEELEKRNMPTELALLPFIESSFDPLAVSSAKAAGIWQFIPSTGKYFNLKQNIFRDERRDVVASTDAALTYLQRLYDMFGDWHLALAAYNWGEGSVQRALNKARAQKVGTDFNSLSRFMPKETREYVPKLQAVKNIIREPERYAVTLPSMENQPYFVTIAKMRDIDVELAARLAELPMEEFRALNPQFNRPVITGGPNTYILLPHANAEKFNANLEQWERDLSSWTTYKVKSSSEKIETIATRFNTTPATLREVNKLPANVLIMAGSTLLVPKVGENASRSITREVADNAVLHYEPLFPDGLRKLIKVGHRDTLYGIARRHNVTVTQIKKWNNLRRDLVVVGQTLQVFVRPSTTAKARPASAQVLKKVKQPAKTTKAKTSPAKATSKGKTTVASSK